MQIYIEDFLIENILINCSILSLIKVTTKSKSSIFKMILSSIVGATISVFYTFFIQNTIILNIFKIISAILIILIGFKNTKKQFTYNFILLFLYTYALGGIITSLNNNITIGTNSIIINPKISLFGVCLSVIVLTNIFKLIARSFKSKMVKSNYIYPITITCNKKSISINAYLDTGNLVKYNNFPVIIIDAFTFSKIATKNLKFETLEVSTATSKKQMTLFQVDNVTIKTNKCIKLEKQFLAVSPIRLGDNYNALLSPEIL